MSKRVNILEADQAVCHAEARCGVNSGTATVKLSSRFGWVVDIKPKIDRTKARAIMTGLKKRWAEEGSRESYVKCLADASDKPTDEFRFAPGEDLWELKEDKHSWLLNLPRVLCGRGTEVRFDTRQCFAVCSRGFTTKLWTRVSLPINTPTSRCYMPFSDLRKTAQFYKTVANASLKWALCDLKKAYTSIENAAKIGNPGQVEIYAVGIKNEPFLRYFEALQTREDANALEMLDVPEFSQVKEAIKKSFDEISERPMDFEGRLRKTDNSKHMWLIIPVPVETVERIFETRKLLALMRIVGSILQVIAVGYDDTVDLRMLHAAVIDVASSLATADRTP